jgi:hypothetical protein
MLLVLATALKESGTEIRNTAKRYFYSFKDKSRRFAPPFIFWVLICQFEESSQNAYIERISNKRFS